MSREERGPDGPAEELALLEHVARTIGDFVLVTDLSGRLTWVNDAVLDRSGWTRDELLGRSWELFLPPSTPPGLAERVVRKTRAGGFRGDVRNVTRAGEEFWVALKTSVLRKDGQPQRPRTVALTQLPAVSQTRGSTRHAAIGACSQDPHDLLVALGRHHGVGGIGNVAASAPRVRMTWAA